MKTRLEVLEKNRLIGALLTAGLPVGLLAFGAFLLFGFGPGALGVHLAVISAVVRYSVARENARAKPVARDIEISPEGIHVDGELVPRSRIKKGWYQPRASGGSTVRVFDRYDRVLFEARVSTEEQAQELLRALGLDVSQQRTEFSTVARFSAEGRGAGIVGSLVGIAVVSQAWRHTGMVFFLGLTAVLLALVAVPSNVVVGVDGVLIKWLWQKRFIRMADIVTVSEEGETGIRVKRRNGPDEIIATASRKQRHRGGVLRERRDMILARIREAWQAHRARGSGADVSMLVARGERSLDDWKEALAKLESADAGYRQASLREEDLWRVVEDPRAAEDARAAAAVLLRRGLDEPGKARVRVAAEATASPKLRVALEAALSEDDAEALEALDELEFRPLRAGESADR